MSDTPASNALPTSISLLTDGILREHPLHRKFIEAAFTNLCNEELLELERFIGYCLSLDLSMDYLVESYLTLVEDTISEQIYFKNNKHYRYSSFAEVADKVYFNPDYMSRYMHGLAISTFLWPNHVAIDRYFLETLPKGRSGKYLEVGPGHGRFMMTAVRNCGFTDYLGVDISATSIEQTGNIIRYFMPDMIDKVRLETRDFLADDQLESGSFDAIIAGEVVEHVDQPEAFLCRIADLAKKDAHIFLTTCINTPAIDHIYLWRNPNELMEMIQGCGLRIKDTLTLPYQGKTLQEAMKEDLSVNFAFLLEKST